MKLSKVTAGLLACLLMLSAATGCSQEPAASSAAPSGPASSTEPSGSSESAASTGAPSLEGVTLRFVTANQPCVEKTVQENLGDFEAKTGAKVNMEVMGTDQFTNKVTVELTAQTKSLDLFFLRPLNDMKLFDKNGWIADLNPYLKDDAEFDLGDYYESALGSCTYNDKLYGIPMTAESQLVYYRKDIFEEKGIKFPETMDEMLAAAEKLTDKSNEFYGFVGRGKSNILVTQFSTYLRAFGGDFNSATESLIGTPEALEAVKFYGKLAGEYGPPGIINMSWPEAAALFGQGKAAMFADADAIYANVVDPSNSTLTEDQIGFGLMPAGPAGRKPFYAVVGAYSISAFSEQKEAAAEFIKWAASKEMDKKMMIETANPGCRASTWEDPEATASWPAGLLETMVASREVAVPGDRPTVINVTEARDIISVPLLEAIQGKDPADALKKANEDFQALIDKENAG